MFCKLTPEEEVRMHILFKGHCRRPQRAGNAKVHPARQCDDLPRALYAGHARAFWLNIHLRAHADEASLVKGAFLHDFYLYDWHNCSNITHWHGFKHPRIARYNAEVMFAPDRQGKGHYPKPYVAADPHRHPPQPRGRAGVCMADKMSSSYETVLERRAKRKTNEP